MVVRSTSLQHLLRAMFVCWATMQLLCYPLWHGLRDFPLVPVWDLLLKLPWYLNDFLFYAGLGSMLLLLWKPNRKWATVLFVLLLISCLLDQNRWQPWHYQFMWMLAAYVFLQKEKQVVLAWQIILVSVYFFSGLSKLQPAFIHDIWNYLFLQSWVGISSNNEWLWRAGYLVPIAEMGFALLLLTGRFRKFGVVGLITMHLLLLVWLGPFGLNINKVIWPWNIVMTYFLLGLFYHRKMDVFFPFFRLTFIRLMFVACCVLPWLSIGGYWDRYLSFAMYSGGVPHMYICNNNNTVLMKYAPYMSKRSNRMLPCDFPIPVSNWAMATMFSIPNPEKRVFAAIAQQWKAKHPDAGASFYLYTAGFSPKLVKFNPK